LFLKEFNDETVPYINNSLREKVQSEVRAASFLQQFNRMTSVATIIIKFE